MKNYHEEITYLSEDFFNQLGFKELEEIFQIPLIGLENAEIEENLEKIRIEWNELNWNEVMQIIGDYSI